MVCGIAHTFQARKLEPKAQNKEVIKKNVEGFFQKIEELRALKSLSPSPSRSLSHVHVAQQLAQQLAQPPPCVAHALSSPPSAPRCVSASDPCALSAVAAMPMLGGGKGAISPPPHCESSPHAPPAASDAHRPVSATSAAIPPPEHLLSAPSISVPAPVGGGGGVSPVPLPAPSPSPSPSQPQPLAASSAGFSAWSSPPNRPNRSHRPNSPGTPRKNEIA